MGSNFGTALEALKVGARVTRKGWNAPGQWVSMTPGKILDVEKDNIWTENIRNQAIKNGGTIELRPYFILKTAQDDIQIGWTPSTSDCLAGDWVVVDD